MSTSPLVTLANAKIEAQIAGVTIELFGEIGHARRATGGDSMTLKLPPHSYTVSPLAVTA